MAKIISVINHKGGVGKTETVYRLSNLLSSMKVSTIAVDFDPQANLTDRYPSIADEQAGGVCKLLDGTDIAECMVSINDFLGIIPCTIDLENVSISLQQKSFGRITALKSALAQLESYSYEGIVLVDCPPNAGILTINALCASTHVLIPSMPDKASIKGVHTVLGIVKQVADDQGAGPEVIGTVATIVDEVTKKHIAGMQDLRSDGMPKCIASIPKRSGVDADRKLSDAYHPLAAAIAEIARGDS